MKSDRLKTMLRKGRCAMAVWALALIGIAANVPAQATECTKTITPLKVSFGTVLVPDSMAVGTEIKSASVSVTIFCPATGGPWVSGLTNYNMNASALGYPIFETGTQGIGIKVTPRGDGSRGMPARGYAAYGGIASGLSQVQYILTLVKTANIVAAGANVNIPSLFQLYANSDYSHAADAIISVDSTRVGVPTCTADAPSQQITLQPVSVTAFRAVGDTAIATPFNIALSCSGNDNIFITLTDLNYFSNTTSNLTLAADSTAKGVQLQILKRDHTPVSYGVDSYAPGNLNQWKVGTPQGGHITIPMTVQYIRTGTVTAGTVKAAATYTLSYQ